MKHPDAPLIVQYLQTIIRNTESCVDSVGKRALKFAAQNVAAHLSGDANMKDVFEEVIQRYPQPATEA